MVKLQLFIVLAICCVGQSLCRTTYRSVTRSMNNKNNIDRLEKLTTLKGGFTVDASIELIKTQLTTSPSTLFNSLLFLLVSSTAIIKGAEQLSKSKVTSSNNDKPKEVQNFQQRFLSVFWLLRMADWLAGPYFYDVYSSKIINGVQATPDLVSKLFLVGFASTGLLGPWIGSLIDNVGRKAGTIAFTVLYALAALSTASSNLVVLLLGRFASGVGTSLLHSAPEAWLVGEHQKKGFDGKWLGQTFGWAYAGDSLVAISAGQLASVAAASTYGASGPFLLSLVFLGLGALLATINWRENVATKSSSDSKVSVSEALSVIAKDKKILLVGAVQALFEGAMYIFVLQWPPAIKAAIMSSKWIADSSVPYGTVFSCFMVSIYLYMTIELYLHVYCIYMFTIYAYIIHVHLTCLCTHHTSQIYCAPIHNIYYITSMYTYHTIHAHAYLLCMHVCHMCIYNMCVYTSYTYM